MPRSRSRSPFRTRRPADRFDSRRRDVTPPPPRISRRSPDQNRQRRSPPYRGNRRLRTRSRYEFGGLQTSFGMSINRATLADHQLREIEVTLLLHPPDVLKETPRELLEEMKESVSKLAALGGTYSIPTMTSTTLEKAGVSGQKDPRRDRTTETFFKVRSSAESIPRNSEKFKST